MNKRILGAAVLLALVLLVGCKLHITRTDAESYGARLLLGEGFTSIQVVDEASAVRAAMSMAAQLGMNGANDGLTMMKTSGVRGDTYYAMQQTYNGLPVYGSSIIVGADAEGGAFLLSASTRMVTLQSTEPKLDSESALDKARKYALDTLAFSRDGLVLGAPELIVYDNRLAYRVNVLGYADGVLAGYELLLDANRGNILCSSPALNSAQEMELTGQQEKRTVRLEADSDAYWMWSIDDLVAVYTPAAGHAGDWYCMGEAAELASFAVPREADPAAVDALASVLVAKDYFSSELGVAPLGGSEMLLVFTGIDGGSAGAAVPAGNAFYFDQPETGSRIIAFGRADDGTDYARCVDVTAHEYAHGVIQNTVELLPAYPQARALGEAFADVFGLCAESWASGQALDWELGGLRKFSEPQVDCWAAYSDEADAHTNATLATYAAWLMAAGQDEADRVIGSRETVQELWYRTLLCLSSDAGFDTLRSAMEFSADRMERAGTLTAAQAKRVTAVFDHLGIAPLVNTFLVGQTPEIELYASSGEEYYAYSVELYSCEEPAARGELLSAERLTDAQREAKTRLTLQLTSGDYWLEFIDAADAEKRSFAIVRVVEESGKQLAESVQVTTDFGLDYDALYDGYIRETLIPRYGIAELAGRMATAIGAAAGQADNAGVCTPEGLGLLGAYRMDLDGDRVPELIVSRLELGERTAYSQTHFVLDVFSVEAGAVVSRGTYDTGGVLAGARGEYFTLFAKRDEQAGHCLVLCDISRTLDPLNMDVKVLEYGQDGLALYREANLFQGYSESLTVDGERVYYSEPGYREEAGAYESVYQAVEDHLLSYGLGELFVQAGAESVARASSDSISISDYAQGVTELLRGYAVQADSQGYAAEYAVMDTSGLRGLSGA